MLKSELPSSSESIPQYKYPSGISIKGRDRFTDHLSVVSNGILYTLLGIVFVKGALDDIDLIPAAYLPIFHRSIMDFIGFGVGTGMITLAFTNVYRRLRR